VEHHVDVAEARQRRDDLELGGTAGDQRNRRRQRVVDRVHGRVAVSVELAENAQAGEPMRLARVEQEAREFARVMFHAELPTSNSHHLHDG